MRIRSVKPEFLEDDILADLEIENPRAYCMLTFLGLWMASDKQGVFPWNPRILHVHILPLISFKIEKTLALLEEKGLIRRFLVEGRLYGLVINFKKHQRINGREAQEEAKYPISTEYLPIEGSNVEVMGKQHGSNTEATRTTGREGKGREGKGNGVRLPNRFPTASQVTPQDAADAAEAEASANEADLFLYHEVEKTFLSKNDDRFTDYPKEGKAIKGLIKKAKDRGPDDPIWLLHAMLEAFWKLRCSDDKFWKGQPFLPSALNSSAIWDRVLETMRNKERMTDPVAMRVAKGEMV